MRIVGVGVDGDGHFFITNISDREETICHLKTIQDGDYYDNLVDEYGEADPRWLFSGWLDWLRNFEQRGIFEFIELK